MIPLPAGVEAPVVVVLGLILGSFLNVVIHRLPRRESVVGPGSHCPACAAPIPWYRNLPVASFALQRGRCAACGARISWRYPIVELTAAAVLLLVWWRFGLGVPFLIYAPFALAMVALFAIDLEHQLLPDRITKPGIVFGLAVAPWNPSVTLVEAAIGVALGYGLLWALAWAYEKARGDFGLGGGDLKLAAMIGAFAGPKAVIEVLLVASLAGTAFGLGLVVLRRATMKSAIPFGCFLAPAALAIALVGADGLWRAWQSLVLRHVYGVEVATPEP